MNRRWILLVSLLQAGGCASVGDGPEAAPMSPSMERGRRIVARACVGCHAVNPDRASAYRAAPPLWLMPGRHTPESLQRAIAASPVHESSRNPLSMPSIVLTQGEAADVIAYVGAFAKADARGRRRLDIVPCIATAC